MHKTLSKSGLVDAVLKSHPGSLTKRDIRGVFDALVKVGHKELKRGAAFVMPGFAKFVVVKRAATKERKGINPFTGEETVFAAKPARKAVRVRPVKAIKDVVG